MPLVLKDIHKSFNGVRALKGVGMEIREGEIHGLVGENGAGKSTLIKVAGGALRPDRGTILLDGIPVRFAHPRDAQRAGIVVIHQTPTLCPHLSVAENILLGDLPIRWGFVDWKRAHRRAAEALKRLGVDLPLSLPVTHLTTAQRQLVALARALSLHARWLILDEPTAPLSRPETERLFVILDQLRDRGIGILFVSHRLEEILEICDRVTVLRDGEKVGTFLTPEVTRERLIAFMVGERGRERERERISPSTTLSSAPPLLKVHGVHVRGFVGGVSFEVRGGEVVGLFGLVGSGRSELAQALVGLRKLEGGIMEWKGKPIQFRSPKEALSEGVIYLPEDRLRQGLFPPRSVRENISLPHLSNWSHFGTVIEGKERRVVERQAASLRVRMKEIDQPVMELSGGNQQKVVLARWLLRGPQLLILDEPTNGIDVATKAEIHALIRELRGQGKSVLLISSDLSELKALCDRILVMHRGNLVAAFPSTAPQEQILKAASGIGERKGGGKASRADRPLSPLPVPREWILLSFLFVVALFVGWRNPAFLTFEHWQDLLIEGAPTLIAAGAMALVISSGNLDLSIGSILGACAMAAGHVSKTGLPLPFVIATALSLGAAIGFLNGFLTTRFAVSSLVVTLGTMGIIRGTMLVFTKGYWVIGLPENFRSLGVGETFGVPNPIWIAAMALFSLWVVSGFTRWGRDLYAIGSNATAAWLAGIPVTRRIRGLFVLCGMLVGLAALIHTARFPVVQSETGKGFELAIITAAVLGGVNIFGGEGSVFGAALGALAVTVLHSALTFLHLPGEWDLFALGALILLSVTLDALRKRSL